MSKTPRIPSYRLHKATGQAVVVLGGRSFYLGKFGSESSKAEYGRLISEWLTNQRRPLPAPSKPAGAASQLTVNRLILLYWEHVKSYYVKHGQPTSEQEVIRQCLRFVRQSHGPTRAVDFGPLALKAIRQAMVEHGWCRRSINKQVGRIKRMFAWAVENELLPASVHQALTTVAGLRKDRSGAREKAAVRPVAPPDVEAVLPRLPAMVRTMVLVQRLCGGRPQDMVEMKPRDIDRSGLVWEYRPGRHKAEHHDRERIVFLGPQAQALLQPYLAGLGADEHVFSPIRSERQRHVERRLRQGRPPVPEPPRKAQPGRKWARRDHYDVASYRRAIRRACQKAGVPVWFPLQLRHWAGTRIRKEFGLEASQAVLGHAELGVTQVYAEVDLQAARSVMTQIG